MQFCKVHVGILEHVKRAWINRFRSEHNVCVLSSHGEIDDNEDLQKIGKIMDAEVQDELKEKKCRTKAQHYLSVKAKTNVTRCPATHSWCFQKNHLDESSNMDYGGIRIVVWLHYLD